MTEPTPLHRADKRIADLVAVAFALIIVLYAASGPLSEFVRWVIANATDGFDEMSRRDQRLVLREHWLGAAHRSFEQGFLLPTGLIIGLPITLSFVVSALTLHKNPGLRLVNWGMAALSVAVFTAWIAKIFVSDAGMVPSVSGVDYVAFVLAMALTLYLTYRMYGGFIVGFSIFWIVYFFARGWLPEWAGILAGSEATIAQNLRTMVLNFWAQTGGMFGQPVQVVTGNVLIFIVFGAILMGSGAGDLLMKIANRLTGGLTGGAAHAAVASSALFGTLSGAAISNVVSTGVMTIPVIKKSGFKPAFSGAVEAAASTGGQIMPPVMGVVAFFVAGQIGLEYRYIVVAAVIPAIFYYLGTFLAVYFEARRLGIGALPDESRPQLTRGEWVQTLVFVMPLWAFSATFLFIQPSVPEGRVLRTFSRPLIIHAGALPRLPLTGEKVLWRAFVSSGPDVGGHCRHRGGHRAHRRVDPDLGLSPGGSRFSWRNWPTARCFLVLLIVVALGSDRARHGPAARGDLFHHRHRAVVRGSRRWASRRTDAAPLRRLLRGDVDGDAARGARGLCRRAHRRARTRSAPGFNAAKIGLAGFRDPLRLRLSPGRPLQIAGAFRMLFGEARCPAPRAMMDIATAISWFAFSAGSSSRSPFAIWLLASALAGHLRPRQLVGGLERVARLVARRLACPLAAAG
jgi:hypothetical protein